mmetsp:Transcript_6547/g.25311  ORF Transcript_6547/g.25311 Transcript_6547/m.25311 type:complete len:288 (+) Transcript_6547:2425-3288(+)|eukprot:scaffold425_cov373-Pinguiococcus_pyrenoidosus.AAC.11
MFAVALSPSIPQLRRGATYECREAERDNDALLSCAVGEQVPRDVEDVHAIGQRQKPVVLVPINLVPRAVLLEELSHIVPEIESGIKVKQRLRLRGRLHDDAGPEEHAVGEGDGIRARLRSFFIRPVRSDFRVEDGLHRHLLADGLREDRHQAVERVPEQRVDSGHHDAQPCRVPLVLLHLRQLRSEVHADDVLHHGSRLGHSATQRPLHRAGAGVLEDLAQGCQSKERDVPWWRRAVVVAVGRAPVNCNEAQHEFEEQAEPVPHLAKLPRHGLTDDNRFLHEAHTGI